MQGVAPWWQSRRFVLAAALAAVLPLLFVPLPPLVDLPGHIGRYRILAEAGTGPLAQHYDVHRALIGNLGVDLLVLLLHPLLDVEPAARLVVTFIPLATVLAMLWVAREAHGRLPPAAAFALPLAYGYPFQFGFVNFCLAAAMAMAGLALWLRLAGWRWRPLLFAALAGPLWLCHSFGWAMLGLFAFGAEWQRLRAAGERWPVAMAHAALRVAPMGWPTLLMLLGPEQLDGSTGDWFNLRYKALAVAGLLRERWKAWDVAAAIVLALLVWAALRSSRLRLAPVLAIPALLGFVAFLLLPRLYQGGANVDTRLLPYAVALALLAIDSDDPAVSRRLAAAGALFLAARTAGTTLAFVILARGETEALAAVPALPSGSAVLVLVNQPDMGDWANPRLHHIDGLAIARARVFTNGQWALAGQQLIRPLHPQVAPFDSDPSQLVYPPRTAYRPTDFDEAIARFDRCTFTSVWTVDFPPGRAHAPDLALRWTDGRSAVYRVRPSRCLSPPAPRG